MDMYFVTLICHVKAEKGGAFNTVKYAKKRGIDIIHL